MCGIFTLMARWEKVVAYSEALTTSEGPTETITPMRLATVVHLDDSGGRKTTKMRWGAAEKGS